MLDSRPIAELVPMIEAVIASGGCFRLWPRGRSMLPLLREGQDSVLLSSPTALRRGDILLVRDGDRFVLHRAIRADGNTVTLCGDALTETEGPFPHDAVIAKVIAVYRGERKLRPSLIVRWLYLRRIGLCRLLRRLWHKIT